MPHVPSLCRGFLLASFRRLPSIRVPRAQGMSCRASPDSRARRSLYNGGMARGAFPVETMPHARTDSDEIKDYAENTMNELLGWYGYGKVGAVEAQNLVNHRLSSCSSSPQRMEGNSPKLRMDDITDDTSDQGSLDAAASEGTLDDESSNRNVTIVCAWCQKKGVKLFTLKTSSGRFKTFCSELCFDQCRRAAFKKSRSCDWCKHVRHTVNYVDFQDKDHQLQFCSDKCLNQYKMNIFCKETQAYLQLHPEEASSNKPGCSRSNSPNLITPELWLRDCKESEIGEDEDISEIQIKDEPESPPEVQCDPSDLSMRQTDKLMLENSIGLKADIQKHTHERRKKIHASENEATQRIEKRSLRLRPVAPKPNSSSMHYPNKHFLPESNMITRSASPTIPCPSLPRLNGSMSSRSALSGSPILPPQPLPNPPLKSTRPPPPLMNNDLFHPPLHPSAMFQHPQAGLLAQQQLEAFFAMQNSLRMRMGMAESRPAFPEPNLPSAPLNLSSSAPSALSHPASVMLPYPLVVPFPIPIPIPVALPLSQFLNIKRPSDKSKSSSTVTRTTNTEEQAKRVDDIISKLMSKIYAQNRDRLQEEPAPRKQDEHCAADSSTHIEGIPLKSLDTVEVEQVLSRKSKHKRTADSSEKSKRLKAPSNL